MEEQKLKTGFIYDNRMLLHKLSKQPGHPECPERIEKIIENLKKTGLWNELQVVDEVKPISKEILSQVHRESYVELVESIWPEGCERENMILNGCYYNKYTGESAFLSSGAVIQSIDYIQQKQWNTAFCCVRPPGHHSGASQQCSGFCFFNNVVVGAKYLRDKYSVKKIAIFDFDVHHGDGTQALTYDDHQLLFISIHQYDEGTFYPYKSGDTNKVGEGFNINIGWNTSPFQSAGDDEYILAFEQVVMPALKEFQPEFIFISAGFDSAANDKLGRCQLTKIGYEYMSSRLVKTFPNLLFVLEGGYNLDSIQWASEAVIRRILHPLEENQLEKFRNNIIPNKMSQNAIDLCKKAHQIYWQFQEENNISDIVKNNYEYGEKIISNISKFQIDDNRKQLVYTLNATEVELIKQKEFEQLFWIGNEMKQLGNQIIIDIVNPIKLGLEILILGEENYIFKSIRTKDIENRNLELQNQTKQYQEMLLKHFSNLLKEKKEIIYNLINTNLKQLQRIPINSQFIIDGSNNQIILSHLADNSEMVNTIYLCESLLPYFQIESQE